MTHAARNAVWIAGAVLLAGIVVGSRVLHLDRLIAVLQAWFAELGAPGIAAFAAVYVLWGLLLLPAAVLTVAAGTVFGLLWGTAIAWLAAIATAALAFLIARHAARKQVAHAVHRRPRLRAVDTAIGTGGFRVVLLLRLSPLIPFSVSNYVYGITAVRFWPYLAATALGMLPGTFLYVYLGHAGGAAAAGQGDASAWRWILLGAGLAATAIATVFVARQARSALHGSRQHGKSDPRLAPEGGR